MLYSGVTQEKHSPPRLWSTLLQALLPDLSSHLAQGLFSNSQHITATNHQCPSSSLCLLGLGQEEPSLQLLAVLGLPGAVYPSAAESLTQSISLPMPPKPSDVRTFPVSGISMSTRNMSILPMSHEYSHSVHHSSEKHICTAQCRVKRMCTPA